MTKKIVVMMMIVSLFITGCGCSKKTEKPKEPNKEEVSKEPVYNENGGVTEVKNLDNLTLELVYLEYVEGISTIKTKVTNNGEEKTEELYINIICKDKNGNEVTRLLGYIEPIKSKESTVLISNAKIDLSKIESITYEKRK